MEKTNIDGIEKALNEDAGKASAIWLTFITFELYLVLAFGSITYRDLLLETSLKLPILGTELPLLGFAEIAPGLLVVVHFYILLQFAIFDGKVFSYDRESRAAYPISADRQNAYQRLGFFFRLQSVFERRSNVVAISLGLIGWLTLVVAPVLILLQALLTFLPYHSQQVAWTIRALLAVDVLLVVALWRPAARPDRPAIGRLLQLSIRIANAILLVMVIAFSAAVATYPGEGFTSKLPYHDRIDNLRYYLFEGTADNVTGRPTTYFSNRIVATDQIFVSEKDGKLTPLRSFRGRDLSNAILSRSDLRGVDFTGAMLNGAVFNEAKLQGSIFKCGQSDDGADIDEKHDLPWPMDQCTWAQGASFKSANLESASFFSTHLENSDFQEASLANADMTFVKLNGASLNQIRAVGATLIKSDSRGTSFAGADLTATSLFETDFTASLFDNAILAGAGLKRTVFDGCSLVEAKLQAATLDEASFRGAILTQAGLWRTHWSSGDPDLDPVIEATNVSHANDNAHPWDDDRDPKKTSFGAWKKAVTESVPAGIQKQVAADISVLDPQKSSSKGSLLVFIKKKQPKFAIETQLVLLTSLLCTDDADFSMAARIATAIHKREFLSQLSAEQREGLSKRFRDAANRNCRGIVGSDDRFWALIDEHEGLPISDFSSGPIGFDVNKIIHTRW